jgi:hypothetical protein
MGKTPFSRCKTPFFRLQTQGKTPWLRPHADANRSVPWTQEVPELQQIGSNSGDHCEPKGKSMVVRSYTAADKKTFTVV